MKRLCFAIVFLLCFTFVPAEVQKNDVPFAPDVVTPHVAWSKPLPGGSIKAFAIGPVADGRDVVELSQRLDLVLTTVSIDRSWDVNCWGIGDYYGHETRGDIDDFSIVYGYVEKHLTGPEKFDVIVLPGLNGWSRLTRASRDAILKRVREGAGLVLLHPFVGDVKGHPFKGDEREGDTRIWEVSPLINCPDDFVSERGYPELNQEAITRARWEVAAPHFITNGVALDLMPAGSAGCRIYKYQSHGEVLIQAAGHPVLAVQSYGKGRVVAFSYVEQGYIPEAVDPVESKIYWDYWEYYYALLARSVQWASGQESGFSIASFSATGGADAKVQLRLIAPEQRQVELEFSAGSEFTEERKTTRVRQAVTKGENPLEFSVRSLLPDLASSSGKQIWNVIVRDAQTGASLAWRATSCETPKRATLNGVNANAEVYRVGDLMSIGTQAAGDLAGLKIRVSVSDELGRLVFRQEAATRGEKTFFWSLDHFLGKNALITAELVDPNGAIIGQLRAKPIMVVQQERRPKEYQGMLPFGGTRHFFTSLRQRMLRGLAMDTGFTWGAGVNNELDIPRGYFGVYWYDRGPTDPEGLEKAIADFNRTGDFGSLEYLTKKELYRRTGDKRFLVRSPSLDDPQVLKILADLSRTAARNKAVYNMDYYFVGDEGSLTSYTDPVDFCWGSHTLADFRKWLRSEYGSLDALNRTWGSSFNDWDSVVPLTTEEAKKSGKYAPWADHRTYMEISFVNAYKIVRDAVLEGDKEGHIALSGTQVTNAYNGCDWYRLDQVIDHFLSYSGGNQWDLHRSFAKPGAMVGFWTGYGRSGQAVQHEIWSAALNNVLYPNLFWSYSVINPDFTWSKSGKDMGEAFSVLRFQGVGKLLMEAKRRGDGIAIHYSVPSVHAATILGYHPRRGDDDDEPAATPQPSFAANRDGWAKVLSDLGLSYDFVSYAQVEEGVLGSGAYRVLVLPFSIALSAGEVEAIRSFAEKGGIVLADTGAGMMDQHCAWQSPGMLDLFGISGSPSEKRTIGRIQGQGVSVTADGQEWELPTAQLSGLTVAEAGLTCREGKSLVSVGSEPAAITRRVGAGWMIYLNLLLDQYPQLRRSAAAGAAYTDLVSALLKHAKVEPEVKVLDASGRSLPQTLIARYALGNDSVLGILQEVTDVTTRFGADGVTRFERKADAVDRQKVTVRLPARYHVTDVRSGRYLGETDSVAVDLVAGDALLLGLTHTRPALKLEAPDRGARGAHLAFAIQTSAPGKRLVRCHFYAPDGKFLPVYAQNLVLEGENQVVLPTALNDPAGTYRLKVEDILTGASAEAKFVLE